MCELLHRLCELVKVRDELVQIVHQSQEALHFFPVRGAREIEHFLLRLRRNLDTKAINEKAEELHSLHSELAFVDAELDAIFLESLEHSGNVLLVLLQRFADNLNVVNVDNDEVTHIVEYLVHGLLEIGGRITRAEWHSIPFIELAVEHERQFLFV